MKAIFSNKMIGNFAYGILGFVVAAVLPLSCKKVNNTHCKGYIISVTTYRYISGLATSISWYKVENNGSEGGSAAILDNVVHGLGTYDRVRGCYYMLGLSPDPSICELKKLNFATSEVSLVGAFSIDTVDIDGGDNELMCNSTSNIIYAYCDNNGDEVIYEVCRNGVFGVKEIYRTQPPDHIQQPVIDELSGHIYFRDGSYFKRLDPETGTVSIVSNFTDKLPIGLFYNPNDGMIYGIDTADRYRLVRIRPSDGSVQVKGRIGVISTYGAEYFFHLMHVVTVM